MPHLLIVAPAPVIIRGDNVLLDVKFAEGMAAQTAAWDGPVDCLLWEGSENIPFPVECARAALPYGLITLPQGASLPQDTGQTHDLIFASGDMHRLWDWPVRAVDLWSTRWNTPIAPDLTSSRLNDRPASFDGCAADYGWKSRKGCAFPH